MHVLLNLLYASQAMLRSAARVLCFDVSTRFHAAASMTVVPAWNGHVPLLIA